MNLETRQDIEKYNEPEKSRIWLTNPQHWAYWPLQPIKRRKDNETECALYFLEEKNTVIYANLFGIPEKPEEFQALKRIKYNDIEDMLDDGWRVD
jgi:hypothetical protein